MNAIYIVIVVIRFLCFLIFLWYISCQCPTYSNNILWVT